MNLSGLHFLLTYTCNFQCDHCFVWGSPWQSGTFTIDNIREGLRQAKETDTIKSVYFEGGEPFLYYPILLEGVREAARLGFSVGLVSNAYWATSIEDARIWLEPMAGLVDYISVSSDLFHGSKELDRLIANALEAAGELDIAMGTIHIAQPEATDAARVVGQLPEGASGLMYRGRAARKLANRATLRNWQTFDTCPHEDLREPGRVHLDPFGNVHICQGISLGNIFETPLKEICATYDPKTNPITGTILKGGPAALVQCYELPHADHYADACHLCCEARKLLRPRFPSILMPDQMYGVPGVES